MPRTRTPAPPTDLVTLSRTLAPEIADLPRLSRVVEQFLVNAGRDTAHADDFAAALELDPDLRGWVLRQANSSYSKLNTPVTSVAQAIVVLGVGPLSQLVYAASTRHLLRRRLSCYRYPGNGFWLHSLGVSVAAGALVERVGDDAGLGAEEARVAGLLHDVGKLLLDGRLSRAGGPRHVTLAEERAALGADHGLVSAAVAMHWSLPNAVVDAVADHHSVVLGHGGRCLSLADLIVRHWGLGIWTYARLGLEPPWRDMAPLAGPLDLTRDDLADWCAGLPPILAGLEELVRAIGQGGPPALPDGKTVAPAPASERPSRRERRPTARRESARKRQRRR